MTTSRDPLLGARFARALAFAQTVHNEDLRKGGEIPYLAHLLAVTALVLEDGGNEDEAIAALLHDCAEDHGGVPMLERIESDFGKTVREIVEACSDSLVDEDETKAPWRERKERYIAHLAAEDPQAGALRVSNADKLHNARAIMADYELVGDALWERFSTRSAADQLWYYAALRDVFMAKREGSSLATQLDRVVAGLEAALAEDQTRSSEPSIDQAAAAALPEN